MITYRIDYDFGELTIFGKRETIEPITGLSLTKVLQLIKASALNTESVDMKWSLKVTRE